MKEKAIIGLFLSSYLPLFLILAIKNWPDRITLGALAVVVMCSFLWWVLLNYSKGTTAESFRIIKIRDKMKESLTYLFPYIIAFLPLDVTLIQDWIALIVLLFFVYLVYRSSDLVYVNPILLLFSYTIYEMEVYKPSLGEKESAQIIMLISKKEITNHRMEVSAYKLDENVFLEC